MKDIAPILKSLGLLDSEVKTYLSAMENGPGTVMDLSKNAKLSRQAVYVAIDVLAKRGLMSSALRGKKRYYAAEHPSKLLAYAKRHEAEMKERVQDLQRLLPEIELQIGGERPAVRVFEGKEGIRAIIADMQESRPKQTSEIADLQAMNAILTPEDLKPMRLELKRFGTKVRGIYAGAPTGKTVEADRYFLPKELSGFKSDITVYGDKIAMITFEGKMYSVLIESASLAKALRTLFELSFRCVQDLKEK
jgi:predicted transcriptional regulator